MTKKLEELLNIEPTKKQEPVEKAEPVDHTDPSLIFNFKFLILSL